MTNQPLIWLTRPQADSEAFAEELNARGVGSIVAPIMGVTRCAPSHFPAKPDALLLTSRHAAYALEQLSGSYKTLPVFCVGSATAESARAAGFTKVTYGEGNVLELIPRLIEHLPQGANILYLAGEETRVDMAALLKPHDIHVDKVIVYSTPAETHLPPALVTAIRNKEVTGVSLFSPRSAFITIDLLKQEGLASAVGGIDVFCLSLAVAEAAGALAWRCVHACAIPTTEAMRDLIVSRAAAEVL